jgi:adenine C2-methylase RlmN of 23S rRNA A2503 and tRNA A37
MNTLSKKIRDLLKENCFFNSLIVDDQKTSSNLQTTKILFKTQT